MTGRTIGTLMLTAVLCCVTPSPLWAGTCTAEGAFGIKLGAKLPKKAKRATGINYWVSPFVLPYYVDIPEPNGYFDRYLVRAAGDDGNIFDVVGLKEVPYIESVPEYHERVVPLLKPFAEKFGEDMNLAFEASSPYYYTAEDDQLEYQIFFMGIERRYYMALSCIRKDFQKAAENKALEAWGKCERAAKSDMNKCMSEGVP